MPPIHVTDPSLGLAERFHAGFAYPLRGAALPVVVGLALAHWLTLLPLLGWLFWLLIRGAMYVYALACLRHAAEAYADPPELAHQSELAGWFIVGVEIGAAVGFSVLHASQGAAASTAGAVLLALILPAIVMALALDEAILAALNPLNWFRVMVSIGAPYLLLVGLELVLMALLGPIDTLITTTLPPLLAAPLIGFVLVYATIFDFRWMGVILERHNRRLGVAAEARVLAELGGGSADADLADYARRAIAIGNTAAALDSLCERLDARAAPPELHVLAQNLLRTEGRTSEAAARASRAIDALLDEGDEARALAVVAQVSEHDSEWVPDGPGATARLAEAAAGRGMAHLALKLARAVPNRWPHADSAARCGFLAARLLAQLGERAEAAVLAGKLIVAWPDCAERGEIDRFLAALPAPDAAR